MKRTFKNFDEYSEYYENREYKMNDVDVVENTVTVCADGEFECKNWKTAVRRFFKEINDNSLFDGWKECITECVENGIWKEKEEYNGEHVCGGWFWEVECIDEGLWYVSLTVSKEIEEESESAETVESVEETTVSETETVETEVAEKYIMRLTDDDGHVLCIKVFFGTSKEADEESERIMAETGYDVSYVRYTDSRWNSMEKKYYCGTDSKSALSVVVRKMETAEQETELNAEVAQVEAEQTEENNIPHTVNRGRKSKGLNGYEQTVFSKRLKALHENTNEKQADTAANLGVTRQSFNNWLNAVNEPDFATLIKIAKYYNTSVDYLLGLSDIESLDSNIKTSCTTTGLSQAAVEKLALWTSDDDKRKLWADYLSYYITSPDFEKALEYINKAHNCYNGDLNEDVIVKLWQVSRKIEVVTESLIELEEIPKTGYFDTS